jgi:hypothetical protein
MGNSSYTIQNLVDIARTRGDIAPALPTGGSYETVALSATNDTMTAMLAGSAKGSPFNFKFNRILIPPFYVNSYQQDYASSVVNLGWLESCNAYNTSSTQYPKPERYLEVRRDVMLVSYQTGRGAKISWMQNNTLTYGTWGLSQVLSLTGLKNPGPSIPYTDPAGASAMPANPITQVQDAAGNFWLLTTYGTCGTFNPFNLSATAVSISGGTITVTVPNGLKPGAVVIGSGFATITSLNGLKLTVLSANGTSFTASTTLGNNTDTTGSFAIVPVYPTFPNPAIVATTVTDGSVVWTAINPQGQGFRINPMPTQTGPVWQVAPIGQARIAQFTKMQQFIEPIPDDYFTYFKDGFFAQCYRYHPDPKVRQKFENEYKIWMEALNRAVSQGSREEDDFGFVPGSNVMDTGWAFNPVNPAMPYGPWQN